MLSNSDDSTQLGTDTGFYNLARLYVTWEPHSVLHCLIGQNLCLCQKWTNRGSLIDDENGTTECLCLKVNMRQTTPHTFFGQVVGFIILRILATRRKTDDDNNLCKILKLAISEAFLCLLTRKSYHIWVLFLLNKIKDLILNVRKVLN